MKCKSVTHLDLAESYLLTACRELPVVLTVVAHAYPKLYTCSAGMHSHVTVVQTKTLL
jgi:hypothetical protein